MYLKHKTCYTAILLYVYILEELTQLKLVIFCKAWYSTLVTFFSFLYK